MSLSHNFGVVLTYFLRPQQERTRLYFDLCQCITAHREKEATRLIQDLLVSTLNTPNAFGYTPLMLAVLAKDPPIVRRLLEKGVNPNIETPSGITALDMTSCPHTEIARTLKDRGGVSGHAEPHHTPACLDIQFATPFIN